MRVKLNDVSCQILLFVFVVIGYAPISLPFTTLKNDIIQLDLPVKYFISQELHRGQLPLWMYSWAGGFPLGHVFTWSVYNPVTLFFCGVFEYNLTILHLEFLFYIVMGGLGVYRISRVLLVSSTTASLASASVYIFSLILVSCAQFLAYIAAIGILPWVIYFFVALLKRPSLQSMCRFTLAMFCQISWSYPASVLILVYLLVAIFFCHAYHSGNRQLLARKITMIVGSLFLLITLSAPLIYTTYHTLSTFGRSKALQDNNFGYLYFSSVVTFLSPFYTVGKTFPSSTFLFQNVFVGGMSLSVALWGMISPRRKKGISVFGVLLIVALIYLWLSFGDAGLVKQFFDLFLPGWNWFRFPSFFRIFFLLFYCLGLSIAITRVNRVGIQSKLNKVLKRTIACVSCVALVVGILEIFNNPLLLSNYGIGRKDQNGNWYYLVIQIVSLVGTGFVLVKVIFSNINNNVVWKWIIAEVLLIAIASLPLYAISSYSKTELNRVLFTERNLGVKVDNRNGAFVDKNGNSFNGLSVYQNKVNVSTQYFGPLFLTDLSKLQMSEVGQLQTSGVIFTSLGSKFDQENVRIENDKFINRSFTANVKIDTAANVFLYQLWHPLWKAYVNDKPVVVQRSKDGLVYVPLESGMHSVTFRFQSEILNLLTWVHFILLGALVTFICVPKIKKYVRYF